MSSGADGTKEALRRIAAEAERRTGKLDLRDLGLKALPEALFRLRHLRVLDLGARRPLEGDHQPNAVDAQRFRLAELTELEEIRLDKSDLSSLDFAAGLGHLLRLSLSGTQVADLTPLGGLAALQSLDCAATQVADLTPIADLRALETLVCSGTQVADLTPIADLTALQTLACSITQVADLTPIAGLTALQNLFCSHTQVVGLTPLAGLTALQRLSCSGTQVADLTPLAGLTALQSLDCSSTQVADLAPILSLVGLEELDCRDVGLRMVPEEIARLDRLRRLDLQDNALTTLPKSLGRLTSLGTNPGNDDHGDGLHLEGNPLEAPLSALIAPGQPEATRNVLAWLRGELEPVAQDPAADPLDAFPAIPAQGAGGHVILDAAGAIAFAPPEELDAEGNNLRRLRSLHPELCELAHTLRAALDRDNRPHHFLLGRVDAYRRLLDRPLAEVDFDLLFNAGVRLENAIRATGRQIAAGELPPLDLEADEAAESLLSLHALFILATRSGQDALEEAPRYRLTAAELAELRAAISAFVAAAQGEPTLVRPEVAAALRENATEIGSGRHPERSTLVGAGMARNVTITTIAAGLAFAATAVPMAALGPAGGVVGGPATLLMIEALKKSKPFAAVIEVFRVYLDRAAESPDRDALAALGRHRDFVLRLEPILRRLAALGGQFGFLNRALDRLREPLPPIPPQN